MEELGTIEAQEFAETLKSITGTTTAKHRATVKQVDADGTVWVQVPGSNKLTPIASSSVGVSVGDTVTTEFRNGSLYVEGNETDPPSGISAVTQRLSVLLDPLRKVAETASKIASEAAAVAHAVNQHFWHDDNGAHVTDVTQAEWEEAAAADFPDVSSTKPYHNFLANSLGILLRSALTNLVSITRSAIAFYDGLGNTAANIVARFGADGAQIGLTDESHMELDYHSLQMVDKFGSTYFHVSDLRDSSNAFVTVIYGDGVTSSWAIPHGVEEAVIYDDSGNRVYPARNWSCGRTTPDVFTFKFLPDYVIPVGYTARLTNHSGEPYAFTFGRRKTGSIVGYLSASLGLDTTPVAALAVACGWGTIAASIAQTALGKFNVRDVYSKYALIIGNGTNDTARSNAAVITWHGEYIAQGWAGVIQMFAGSNIPAGWLLCDGSAISRDTYSALFAAIGTTWGAGDGSTTFNLPDLRGRSPIGAGTGSGLTARALGDTGGSEDAIIPYHRHTMGAHTHADPGAAFLTNDSTVARRTVSSGSGATNQLYSAGATERKTATGAMNGSPYTGYAGTSGNTDNANMQPFTVINFIIHTGITN